MRMNNHWTQIAGKTKTRRQMLKDSSAGFGALALNWLLGREALAEDAAKADPLAVRAGHHTAPPDFRRGKGGRDGGGLRPAAYSPSGCACRCWSRLLAQP